MPSPIRFAMIQANVARKLAAQNTETRAYWLTVLAYLERAIEAQAPKKRRAS